ncbi:uncharacterized protein LOC108808405 [Raphanus sativus]|uniref:Uncharacterized protein LOC108808405 n=1 Tax=Raphanus sativus TaxID=3726 RepID=A0A6J0JK98_RAPSA|nr:uncharacterized protein LOC108808405 [Raphanus sativus]
MDIRDGCTVRFWTDLWHPRGRLIEVTGDIGTQKLGVRRNARICDVFVDGDWRFRNCRDQRIQELARDIKDFPLSLVGTEADGLSWKCGENSYIERFVAAETWHLIREHKTEVQWHKLFWFSEGVPRYSFITWLAVRDRLATGHITSQWGQPQVCIFCGEPDETRDHLFFACPFTFTLWIRVVGNLLGIDPDPDWEETISCLMTRSYDKLTFILLRLVLQVTIYFVWRERNDRRHTGRVKSVDQVAE